jgi:hypothetical protein
MNEHRLQEMVSRLREEVDGLKRKSQYSLPPSTGRLRDRLVPPDQYLAHRFVDDSQPLHGDTIIWDAAGFEGPNQWRPARQGRVNLSTFNDGAADFFEFWFDSGEVAAGFGISSADTIANPYATPGTYTASIYYANIGCYDFDTGNLIGRIEGWFTPVPANLGAADTAADGSGPYWYINASSGFTYLAHPTLDTRFMGQVIVYFNLGDGTGQPLRLESKAGVPTHSATEGTLCFDRTNNDLYANTDGSTTWLLLAGPSAETKMYLPSTADSSVYMPFHRAAVALGQVDVAGSLPVWMDVNSNLTFKQWDATNLWYYMRFSNAGAAMLAGNLINFWWPFGPGTSTTAGWPTLTTVNTVKLHCTARFNTDANYGNYGIGFTSNAAATTFSTSDSYIFFHRLISGWGLETSNGSAADQHIAGTDNASFHQFRLEWTATNVAGIESTGIVRLYVDDVLTCTLDGSAVGIDLPIVPMYPLIAAQNATNTIDVVGFYVEWE